MDDAKHLPDIDPSKLEVTKTTTPKQVLANEDLVFGRTFTGKQARMLLVLRLTHRVCRPYALYRMDRLSGLASSSNHSLPEPVSRPRNLRLPLCL